MSEGFIRNLISFIGMLIAIAVFYAGYIAGTEGLWWAGLGSIFVYFIVYKLIEA